MGESADQIGARLRGLQVTANEILSLVEPGEGQQEDPIEDLKELLRAVLIRLDRIERRLGIEH